MAAGDIAIYREATGLQLVNTTNSIATWDTIVREDAIYSLTGSNAVDLGEAGHYLVTYNHPCRSASGNNRSEWQTGLLLEGSLIPYGRSYGYIRRSGGTDEDYPSASTIINVAEDDQLSLNGIRTDSNTATVQRIPAESGLQVLKLPDDYDYLRLVRSAAVGSIAISPSTTPIGWDQQDELDTGSFSHDTGSSPEDITLVEIGRYLISVNVAFRITGGTRIGATLNVILDGTTVAVASTVMRGSNGCQDSSASVTLIVETTSANEILTIEAEVDRLAVTTVPVDSSGITIMKLNDSGQYARVDQTGAGQRIDTNAAVTFDTTQELTSDYSFTNGTSDITINTTDDYLCLGYFNSTRTGGTSGSRLVPHMEWRINNVEQLYGGFGAYNRGTQGSAPILTIGRAGAFINDFAATESISLFNTDESTGTDANAIFEDYGLQVLRIDFPVVDDSSSSNSSETSSSQSDVQSESSTSAAEMTDLICRRFTNPVSGGLNADEVILVDMNIINVYNQAFYGLRIPRAFSGLNVLFAPYQEDDGDENGDDDNDPPYLHRYILDRTSFTPAMVNIIDDDSVDRLISVDETDTANLVVIDQAFGDATQSLDNALNGEIANSLSTTFNGSNENINVGDVFDFSENDAFSFSFYIDLSGSPNNQDRGVMGRKPTQGGTGAGYLIQMDAQGSSRRIGIEFGNGSTRYAIRSGNIINNDFFHCVVTYSGNANTSGVTVYAQSVSQPLFYTNAGAIGSISNSNIFRIGSASTPTDFLECNLDEITIWDKELSQSEVSDIYNGGTVVDPTKLSFASNLLSWYRMGDGDNATTIIDAVGGNNGTLENMDASNYEADVP